MAIGDRYKRLAPGFVRITYSGIVLPHNQTIPIKFASPPTPGVEPDFLTTGTTTVSMTAGVTAWVTAFSSSFETVTNFGIAQCYSVDEDTGIATFIYAVNLAVNGTEAVESNKLSVQAVWTFKTVGGHTVRVTAMEGIWAADSRNVGEVPADARQDVIDYVTSEDNIWYGRDNSYPLAFLAFTSKVNDALRSKQGFTNT